jgi:hypothetical protein
VSRPPLWEWESPGAMAAPRFENRLIPCCPCLAVRNLQTTDGPESIRDGVPKGEFAKSRINSEGQVKERR